MLGVDPAAGIDEIRARYRQLARELHPDRRGVGSNASGDMAAINDAWAVLGDPSRRAAYDRSLSGAPNGATIPTESRPRPSHAAAEPVPVGCVGAVAGGLPWIAVLVIMALIFVFTAYAGSNDGESRNDSEVSTEEVATEAVRDIRGSCIQLVAGATFVVDCLTEPNEGVIVALAAVGGACPDGTEEWLVRQQDVLACTEPGTAVRPAP